MPSFKLFVAPGTCARVPTIALEEIGVPFETELVRVNDQQQKSPRYLAMNPKGKVPLLLVDGVPITENVAILSWLHDAYPEALLLPETGDSFNRHLQIADLAYVSATLHPIVARIRVPHKVADTEDAIKQVRRVAEGLMTQNAKLLEDRFSRGPWWYGDQWSIVDAYIFWAWSRVTDVGFDSTPYPGISDHSTRIQERPSVQRAMMREARNVEELAKGPSGQTGPAASTHSTA